MIGHIFTNRQQCGRFILRLLLLTMLAAADWAQAETEPPAPEETSAEAVICNYLDEYHTYLLGKIKGPTIWFDNFFGDQRAEEDDLPVSFVRFRAVARYTEGEGMTFPMRLRANLNLPKINRRLRLVIFGGNREEDRLRETDNNLDPSLMGAQQEERPNLGLRYLIYKTLRDRFDFGGGLSLSSPASYNGRMRYERLIQISPLYITRFTETGFWDSQIGFGETTRLDFEKILAPQTTGRFSLFGTFAEDNPGLQWGAEINLYRQLSEQSALAFDLGAYGDGVTTGQVTNYRIASRYRRNFLRPWLFFEVEPEMIFPLIERGERDAIGIMTTVLEIQFVT
ncbi:MAG: hypothetical protein HGA96_12625 [Desulfobulbaceae bacterium]|nr:hypothetical protein [Desulfobulbaceae bacterium]